MQNFCSMYYPVLCHFCYTSTETKLEHTLSFILRYLYGSTDDFVTKELLIEAIFCSNKCQRIENYSQGVSIRTWLRAVQEADYVLGNI